jgi:N-formylglutamate amidohydrolase
MLVEQTYAQFGGALLIDAHSMPSSASGLGLRERDHRVDVVLGDNHGEACALEFIDGVERWLSARGLRVRRNQPYAGGFTTQRYGRPTVGRHTLQIEINRALYMDEARHTKLPSFGAVERLITALLDEIGQHAVRVLLPRPIAAE